MEVLSNSASIIISKPHLSFSPQNILTQFQIPSTNFKFLALPKKTNPFILSSSSPFSSFSSQTGASPTTTTPSTSLSSSSTATDKRHWVVVLKTPPLGFNSKAEAIDYYVKTLERVLGSEKDAQMRIYDASWDTQFGFCCDIDEETARELARIGIVTKAQMVDYYAQILAKVLGNEKDAQMCIYHISWQSNFGFCCELDDECARELAGVPGILSVLPDKNFGSENKDYGGNSTDLSYSSEASQTAPVRSKKLFVTGLSFYTSEKTLREAFEGFGELVEVKVIMDKISKRSKGYAFIEYTTEEAASAALKEMNGKIINGWMIVVDAAKPKSSPPRHGRGRTR